MFTIVAIALGGAYTVMVETDDISWRMTIAIDVILFSVFYGVYSQIVKPARRLLQSLQTSEKEIHTVKKSNDMMPEILDNL